MDEKEEMLDDMDFTVDIKPKIFEFAERRVMVIEQEIEPLRPVYEWLRDGLRAGEDREAYAYILRVGPGETLFLLDDEWKPVRERLRVTHLIMVNFPQTQHGYIGLADVFKQMSNIVYQYLTPDVNPAWIKSARISNFVVMDPVAALGGAYSEEVRSLTGSVYLLDSLRSGRERWSASLTQFLAQPHQVDKLSSRFDDAPFTFKDKLDSLLQGPTRNPLSRTQVYHRYSSTISWHYPWLRHLQREYPYFCTFPHQFFIFNDLGKMFSPGADPDWGQYFKSVTHKGEKLYYSKKDSLRVHVNLKKAIKACQQPLMVGIMDILGEPSGHANAIIIDNRRKTLTRFEPHGGVPHPILDAKLGTFADKLQLRYIAPYTYGPPEGIQSILDVDKFNDYAGDEVAGQMDRGWCQAISLLFIHHRLANPELEVDAVHELMLNKPASTLAMEIRSYTNAMVETVAGTCRDATLFDNNVVGIAGLEKQCQRLGNVLLRGQAASKLERTLIAMSPILGRTRNLSVEGAVSPAGLVLLRQTLEVHPNLHVHVQEGLVPSIEEKANLERERGRMHVHRVTVQPS